VTTSKISTCLRMILLKGASLAMLISTDYGSDRRFRKQISISNRSLYSRWLGTVLQRLCQLKTPGICQDAQLGQH
jgi:hypothetical protein